MKTYSVKPTDVVRTWYLIDASEVPLGRMATKIATLLTGKDKPLFSHHIDCGDYVVVTNADQLVTTGKKITDKKYYRHSGYPGALKERSLDDQIKKDSTQIVIDAVRGMLPVNKLRPGRLMRLKVYPGAEHNHEPQKPISVVLRSPAKPVTAKEKA